MRTKCLPIFIDRDLYRRLEQQATANERDVLQEARWLLRQSLAADQAPQFQARDLAAVGAGPERPEAA